MKELCYGSVCSGIEAASIAWEPLGMRPAWFAEIEPFPSAVLAHRWPHVANLGDMTKLAQKVLAGEIESPDVLVGVRLVRHSVSRAYVVGLMMNAAR
ncbi:DNA cytosine methyltransferase [Escherichia coli]|nr:DNA cytosine methyltransferase [Escherichia coli]